MKKRQPRKNKQSNSRSTRIEKVFLGDQTIGKRLPFAFRKLGMVWRFIRSRRFVIMVFKNDGSAEVLSTLQGLDSIMATIVLDTEIKKDADSVLEYSSKELSRIGKNKPWEHKPDGMVNIKKDIKDADQMLRDIFRSKE